MKSIPEIQAEQQISIHRNYGQKLRELLKNKQFGTDWVYREHSSPKYLVGPDAEKEIIAYARQRGWLHTA